MLLTESYRKQQQKLHSEGDYGFKGHTYAQRVVDMAASIGTQDILDYGCGSGSLQKCLGFPIKQYDPCIPEHDVTPEPADFVVCTDVLEHIEPECLDEVLDDLKRVTRNLGFFAVDTRPARKILSDGRNAHLIQQPSAWWFPKLYQRWAVVQIQDILYRPEKSLGFVAVVGGARTTPTTNEGRS
jgi:2-polyprenyl-3-methyl-5-hydroxy-6-metoxy-1,4-benzoquinol methylase